MLSCSFCPDHVWSEFSVLQAAQISQALQKDTPAPLFLEEWESAPTLNSLAGKP
ncbi:MAG: hypothetical protein H7839_23395 [Magnetococcus sp. YQC-5]